MSTRPLIGLSLDSEEAGGWSKMPWYALRQNYCAAVAASGGLPVALPHEAEAAEAYLDKLDGLVITGGAFDVDPSLFGAEAKHETVKTKDARTRFELAILKGALARDLPILGICGGQQLLNVALGGTLIQHIPDSVPDALAHEQPNPRTEAGHSVTMVQGTRLHAICGADELQVNSAHHQAAAEVGRRRGDQRLGRRRRDRGDRGARPALLHRRRVAPGIPHLRGRQADLRRLRPGPATTGAASIAP